MFFLIVLTSHFLKCIFQKCIFFIFSLRPCWMFFLLLLTSLPMAKPLEELTPPGFSLSNSWYPSSLWSWLPSSSWSCLRSLFLSSSWSSSQSLFSSSFPFGRHAKMCPWVVPSHHVPEAGVPIARWPSEFIFLHQSILDGTVSTYLTPRPLQPLLSSLHPPTIPGASWTCVVNSGQLLLTHKVRKLTTVWTQIKWFSKRQSLVLFSNRCMSISMWRSSTSWASMTKSSP